MEDKLSNKKTPGVFLLVLSVLLFVAFLYFLPNSKSKQSQTHLVKLEEPLVEKPVVKEEPVIVEENLPVESVVMEVQPAPIAQEPKEEVPVDIAPQKEIIERRVWQSNRGRLISNKEYVYFGKYIIVKEEAGPQSSENN